MDYDFKSKLTFGLDDLMNFVLLSLLAALMTGSYPTQNAAAEIVNHRITVRFLNGKTGKPIKDDTPNIWLGDAQGINPHTNSNGELVVSIHDPRSQDLRVLPNQYVDCRFKVDRFDGMFVRYSLADIINTGVVSENRCGKQHAEPTPGVLVLYVRPMTFMERWRL